VEDGVADVGAGLQDGRVPEAQDVEAVAVEVGRAVGVVGRPVGVVAAVEFDDEGGFTA